MSNDIDLIYWNGHSINAMTREQLQDALADTIMIIENQQHKNIMLKLMYNFSYGKFGKKDENEIYHSRFANPDYIASFC